MNHMDIQELEIAYEMETDRIMDEIYRQEQEWAPTDEEIESMQRGYMESLECTRDTLFDAMCNLTRRYAEKITTKGDIS